MIKVDLITGFLGSGKTTFLLKYARYLMNQGQRIGILVYDYGALNIDMVLLSKLRGPKCELEMVAAACDDDCLVRRFKTKLIAMAMSGYDRVIIEPSGVFDMDMFFDELRDEPLEKWYEIGSVITVVDANLSKDSHRLSKEEDFILASEAAFAGCILLSKVQLSDDRAIEATKLHLIEAADRIKCRGFKPVYLAKDWQELTDEDYEYISRAGYHMADYVKSYAGSSMAYSSVSFLDIKYDLDVFLDKVRSLFANLSYGHIVRVKGFVLGGQTNYEINATESSLNVTESSIGQNVAIVIGKELNEDKIKELLG